ncbi:TonB-dependent receptor [Sphingomonas melonis]|uniref:Iron complex outermembrane receptor protein n=1 Tax=Sphingomonas melonis TaxID=152682 RepID=A0A7Y9FLU2_9SPHN|nr:TonB-dependent receptor [Sphingomonas melonis]NYD89680.1 iron complex outermembrane receptor protein [Sphingomonas melonis]
MRMTFACGVAFAALMIPGAAFAQSTGTVDAEADEIVVTGRVGDGTVAGISTPNTSKTRAVLSQEFIAHQTPGQTINDTINMLPGVSFQNNDGYGGSGGTLSIRGFDGSRVSQTFDGIPVNDTGNYAIYSNQQLDPELIDQVSVSLGSTDVDSPTASATGSTVNYRSRNPTEEFHARMQGSYGSYDMFRIFGVVDTGNFTSIGTRAWVAASTQTYNNPYNPRSGVDKQQYNAKLYQPIGSSGDFVSLAGHYNRNRNNNFSSAVLRTDPTVISVTGTAPNQSLTTTPRVVGTASNNRFPLTRGERDYDQGLCQTDTPTAGVADVPNTCGTAYDYSYNPSNTANVRMNSRFTLADGLVLTVDPSYSYTKANGGSSAVKGNEGFFSRAATAALAGITTPIYGYIGGQPYFGGRDLNHDGDTLDTPGRNAATGALTNTTQGVELYAPSHTETNRFVAVANLRYDFADTQTARINYTFDYGRHRQTGEVGYLLPNGYAANVFPIDNPILDASGKPIEKRNRKSLAILHQVSGEYRGRFIDDKLTINAGIRAPFFKRKLNNFCVSEAGSNIGFVDCFNDLTAQAAFLTANPTYAAPQKREFNYSKVLPSAGFTFQVAPSFNIYANYSKGLQVPGTDNLYNSFAFPITNARARPLPETTDNIDAGVRYQSGKIQASLAGWYTFYTNRLASAYDPELDVTIYRNLGTVHKYGVDGSIAYAPVRPVLLYVFGSYLKSKILDNVATGECSAANVAAGASAGVGTCTTVGQQVFALTAGKREAGAPVYTFGGRAAFDLGWVQFGAQAKRTGPRYVNDQNLNVVQTYTLNGVVTPYQVYGAKVPAYTTVDLDARLALNWAGLNDRTYLQFNVTNVFDELYVGGFTGNVSNSSVRNAFIGAPRTISGTLVVGF